MNKRAVGTQAEIQVIKHFVASGYELWWHNFYCRAGELDLVFYKDRLIRFVEVRSIKPASLEFLPYKLNYLKRSKLVKAIKYFQLQFQLYYDFSLELVVVCGDDLYFFPDV